MSLSEIKLIDNGAKFYRADLHIHSFGEYASYDVYDTGMTPENIIDIAIKENISVISITDQYKNIEPSIYGALGAKKAKRYRKVHRNSQCFFKKK